VRPPSIGVLWTPPYWGFVGGVYSFNAGYWGPHVGFYGGINYGFGYGGNGYAGGRWSGGNFTYNRSVNNFGSTRITNVYNETITNNNVSRASFNGTGGIQAEANAEQQAMARERHMDATAEQSRHFQAAGSNRELRASENHGNPVIAATARPGQFRGRGVVAADEAEHGGSRSVLGREHGASASAPGHMARAAGEHPAHPDKPVNAARPAQAHAAASHHASQSRPARAPAADHASAPHAERAAAGPRPPHQAPQRVAATHAGATQHPAEARHSGNGGNDKQH
jgi:hypothetical protein